MRKINNLSSEQNILSVINENESWMFMKAVK